MDYIFLIVIIVVMFGMMFWQSKKAKQQQAERQDFRANLQPGTEVITIGVDENGNPLPTDSTDEDQAAQEPIEGEIEAAQTETEQKNS